MLKVKILFVGPSEAGKSVLSNFLSETTEGIGAYIPTQGVRILEYEKPLINDNSKGTECRFEFWDCGSDEKFEACWPALMKDSHGVVIVFNPDIPSHLKEIEMWYSCFIQQPQLLEGQCLLIAHHKPGTEVDPDNLTLRKIGDHPFPALTSALFSVVPSRSHANKLAPSFSKAPPLNRLKLVHSSLEEDPEDIRMEFVKYLKGVANLVNENQDREEMLIIASKQ